MSALRQLHLRGATGAVRTEMWDGREHLVVPVVALQEAVIHAVNSPAAEYVPHAPLAASVARWNGHPLVVGHPTKDGKQISAHTPGVLSSHGFGFIRQASMTGSRLAMEAMVDPLRLKLLKQEQLLADLQAGKPIEVSVGAFVDTNATAGTFGGRSYTGEWTAIEPDHLAFLPGGVGACSLAMGCGAHRAAMLVTAEGFVEAEQSSIDPDTLRTLRDVPQAERDKMPASDFAGPDQRFPIKTQADVDAAAHLVGKAANPSAVKRKIVAIAKRKGLTIPAAWRSAAALPDKSEVCTTCKGSGKIRGGNVTCPDCKGLKTAENPEGINQYSHGDAAKAHEAAAKAHTEAYRNPSEKNARRAAELSDKASEASSLTESTKAERLSDRASQHADDAHAYASHGKMKDASREHDDAASMHERVAAFHESQAKRAGMKGLSMKLTDLKARVLALFDSPEQAASEEAAELVAYNAMRVQLDAAGDAWDAASELVDALIADEEDDPTESPAQEEAEEEVEDARLDAIRMHCYAMMAALQNVCNACSAQQVEDVQPGDPRYMEAFRAAIGKAISAKNMATVQKAHDASHEMHTSTVALGATCKGMKVLAAKDCPTCNGTGQTKVDQKQQDCPTCDGYGTMRTAGEHDGNAAVEGEHMTPEQKKAALKTLSTCGCDEAKIKALDTDEKIVAALLEHSESADAKLKAADAKLKAAEAAQIPAEELTQLRTLAEERKVKDAAEKAGLVTKLAAASKALTKEQLEAKSLDDLKTLATFAKVDVDYSAKGFPVQRGAEGADAYSPPNPYEAGVKALQAKVN